MSKNSTNPEATAAEVKKKQAEEHKLTPKEESKRKSRFRKGIAELAFAGMAIIAGGAMMLAGGPLLFIIGAAILVMGGLVGLKGTYDTIKYRDKSQKKTEGNKPEGTSLDGKSAPAVQQNIQQPQQVVGSKVAQELAKREVAQQPNDKGRV